MSSLSPLAGKTVDLNLVYANSEGSGEASLCTCAGSPKHSLLVDAVRSKISYTGSIYRICGIISEISRNFGRLRNNVIRKLTPVGGRVVPSLMQLQRDDTVIFEPRHEISNNVVCAISKCSDQPAHTRSLIRAFACRSNILSVMLLTEHQLKRMLHRLV